MGVGLGCDVRGWSRVGGGGWALRPPTIRVSLSQSRSIRTAPIPKTQPSLSIEWLATESQLILQLTQQVALALSSPITLYTWPLYCFEAVSVVFKGVQLSVAERKNVVASILETLVNGSTILTQPEKESLNSMIASQISATIDALLRANTVVDHWIEVEVESVWKRIRRWCCCQAKCGTARCAPERQAL